MQHRRAVGSRHAAVSGRRHAGDSGRAAPALPLPRSAARKDPRQHRAALEGHCQHPPAHAGAGLPRVPDADSHVELARRRARLSGAEPDSRGQVLRAAAGAAAVQAAPDGGRLRSLLPDRALLPRRGRTRRSVARRVLPARRRAVLRDAGRRVRARSSRCLPASSGEFSDWTVTPAPFPRIAYDDAMPMYGSDKPDLRNPIKAADVTEIVPRVGIRGVRATRSRRAPWCARSARPARREQSRSFFDKTVGLAETLGLGGLAYIVAAETPKGPLAKYLPDGAARDAVRCGGRRPGRRGVLRVWRRRRR